MKREIVLMQEASYQCLSVKSFSSSLNKLNLKSLISQGMAQGLLMSRKPTFLTLHLKRMREVI